MKRVFLIPLVLFLFGKVGAQTCCSGGVPTANNLGLPTAEAKTIQFSLNYDLNALNTLKTGADKIDSGTRSRLTHTLMLQSGFSVTNRLSFDVFIPWIRQEREIRFLGQVSDFTMTNGLGDVVVLGKYVLHRNESKGRTITGALGTKLPTGSSNKLNNNNIQLNADLQPGSGAWDGILLLEFQQSLGFRPSMSFFARTILTAKGKNNSYLGNNTYQFGTEWQAYFGLSDKLVIGNKLVEPALALRVRQAAPDKFNNENQTGTGGRWAFVNPAINYWTGQNLSFSVSGDIPVFSYVKDTQVTPTYRINVGLFYKLSLDKGQTELPQFNF